MHLGGFHPRSIPAQAGEPPPDRPAARSSMVYPRAGGGTWERAIKASTAPGLSPRRRGNPGRPDAETSGRGSIPAQAGEPRRAGRPFPFRQVYPRAGGGTRSRWTFLLTAEGLSPRRRGNPALVIFQGNMLRSIPAQAGEPVLEMLSDLCCGVYPRAGGGTAYAAPHRRSDEGLSPRRRGNRVAWVV